MIGILTSNFSLYHDLIESLRKREIPFVSLTFRDEIPYNVDVIISSREDEVDFENVVRWEGEEVNTIIDRALMLSTGDEIHIVFGIDPGENIGIAIYGNDKLIRRFITSSPEEAAGFIKRYVKEVRAGSVRVRIGNGARLIRNRIINLLVGEDIKIEMVDESTIHCHDDDAIAASTIAMAEGVEVMGEMKVEPKDGEIREMQRLSRIKSGTITISKELARKVLKGEMELDDAIQAQREKNHE